jgi:SOS-response transcriptional repressor LexA
MQTRREQAVEFLKSQHQKTGKTPSIRGICKRFGLSNKAPYEAFPERKPEMCSAAGVPIDDEGFQKVAKASQALTEKKEKESLRNEELRVLREKEEEIAKELKRAQAIVESRALMLPCLLMLHYFSIKTRF